MPVSQNSIFRVFSGYTQHTADIPFAAFNSSADEITQGNRMNYQVAPFWIYSGKLAFFILSGVVSAFYGIGAFMGYLLFNGLVWQVAVSLRLHRLKEKGLISRDNDISQWLVYVNGIPVREERAILKNPCFAMKPKIGPFFLRLFLLKGLIQCAFIILLVIQLAQHSSAVFSPGTGAGLLTAVILSISLSKTIYHLSALVKKTGITEQLQSESGSLWYQLYFRTKKTEKVPALDQLLAL